MHYIAEVVLCNAPVSPPSLVTSIAVYRDLYIESKER